MYGELAEPNTYYVVKCVWHAYCTAVVDESEEWSFKQLVGTSLKNIRASTGFEPVISARSRVRIPLKP